MIRNFLINYFGFNRQQRNGLLVLMGGIFLLFVIRMALPHFIGPGDIKIKDLPLATVAVDSSEQMDRSEPIYKKEKNKLFKFDPNTVSQDELKQLGFSEKQAASFIRFRNKGFVFQKKEDLKKVFVVSDKIYNNLSQYVSIAEKKASTNLAPDPVFTTPAKEVSLVELNAADSLSLLTLPGIGPAYAKRILKYRSLLGGFTTVDQLKEVYGFPPETFEKVKDKVSVDPANVKKIDLNKDDFKVVTRHPYIGYERTKEIFAFRKKQMISFSNLAELFPLEAERLKILPYLNLAQ